VRAGKLSNCRHPQQQRIVVTDQATAQPHRMQLPPHLGEAVINHTAHQRRNEHVVSQRVGFRHARHGGEGRVLDAIAAQMPDVVHRSLDQRDVVSARLGTSDRQLVQPRRHRLDEVEQRRDLGVFLAGDRAGDKDAEMAD